MRKLSLLLLLPLLAACVSTEGLSAESKRPPAGNPKASLLVEEFGDLQCPACKAAHTSIVKPLLAKEGNAIRYEFRHFPLRNIHAFAEEAAEAAECAADQGKFWEFLDDNYENQSKLSRKDLVARAGKVGVADTALFTRCIKSRIKKNAIQKDYEEGLKRGVQGTPTFFVGGEKVPTNTIDIITTMIKAKQKGQKL